MNFQNQIIDPKNDRPRVYIDPSITSDFITKTFGWMFIGIFSTFLTAFTVSRSYTLMNLIFGQRAILFPILLIAEMFISIYISSVNINKISLNRSKILFIVYSILNGVTLSFLAFHNKEIIILSILVTSMSFASMALYGYLTKNDFSKFISIINTLFITLIGTSFINIFFNIPMFRLVSSYLGAITFILLIAYDTNQLKRISEELSHYESPENISKYSIRGALSLYIKIINLFLYIVKIISSKNRRNK